MQKTPLLSGILLHIVLLIFTEASSSVFVSQPCLTALYTVNIVKQSQNYKLGHELNRRQAAMINVEQKGLPALICIHFSKTCKLNSKNSTH